jgi:agmatinase
MASLWRRQDRFLGFDRSWDEAEWVLMGVPMDFTASFQAGSRFAPPRIREASYALETYSPKLDADLTERPLHDAGDLELPFGQVEPSLALIREAARTVLAAGKHWIALGGDHLVALPLIEEALTHHPDLVVVHWDAHTDLRDSYLGQRLSHATVMRRVAERLGDGRVYQFGIRSGTREEFEWAKVHTRLFPDRVAEPLRACLGEWAGRPVYLTLDVDVLDPAFLPGTGTPEPGGITAEEAFAGVLALVGTHLVGIDIVETMPAADLSWRTAVTAAKLVRELALVATGR